jgi:hypothetical protein
MQHTLKLFYSVQNGGDGSAYPVFMSSQALADYDQDNLDEGWGESCTGSITLTSESVITVKEEIETPESYLVDLIANNYNNDDKRINKFVKEVFPNGKPIFEVQTRETSNEKYLYNDVYVNGAKVASVFRNANASGQTFQDLLNE